MPLQFELKLQRLKVSYVEHAEQPVFIRFKIDEIQFSSSQSIQKNKTFWFMEQNTICTDSQNYDSKLMKIQVFQHTDLIGYKTIFIKEAITKGKKLKQIDINGGNYGKMVLTFSLEAKFANNQPKNLMRRNTQSQANFQGIDKQPSLLSSQSGKFQILKMGVLMYNFSQRLDQVAWLSHELISFLFWQSQLKTIFLGFVLSVIIINIRMSLFLGGVSFLIGRKYIIKFYQNMRPINVSQRIVVPKQNMILLQQMMKLHCQLYEYIYGIIANDDRSKVITYIDRVCLLGLLTSLCLVIFSFDTLVVMGLWLVLALTSPWGNTFKKALLPLIKYANQFVHKGIQKVSNKTKNLISISQQNESMQRTITKQFYIYEYERWWVGQNWVEAQKNKWSDQTWAADLFPRNDPPIGWNWTQPWKIVVNINTDQNGFQYANDFTKQWKNEKTLKTLRRRMWKRKCQINLKQ